ncbi:MAG: spore coat protein CotJB [Oscillospiraceae bacterium]|nr:spore coat protein CotJB [Oscillospiraceae bacterium]
MASKFNKQECSALMDKLCEASFFAHDLNLYLDTHPDDEAALEMFREACNQSEACREAFESCCYPLRACSAGHEGEWDWLDGAWPSERI